MVEVLTSSSMVGLLSMLVAILPVGAGIAYAVRPTEQRLALMRPVSLAGLFAGLCGLLSGAISLLRTIAVTTSPVSPGPVAVGFAEALVPLFLAFGCLTVAWLCVAMGLRRHP